MQGADGFRSGINRLFRDFIVVAEATGLHDQKQTHCKCEYDTLKGKIPVHNRGFKLDGNGR